ncbi:MAG: hypothetical protein K2O18_11430, partial [Oscillospiraceae bacterium]|nr:hypothetical protein [Oscillospiraceae bacterium]
TYLCEALSAAAEVARRLEENRKTDLGLLPVSGDSVRVPLLERKDGGFVWSSVPLPPPEPFRYPKPAYVNDIAAAKLRRLKKEGFWECEVVRFPEPMQDSPEEPPCFPVMLLAVSGQVLPPQLSEHYDDNPEELVDQFAEMFLQSGFRPAMLSVQSERTKVLLEDFCEQAGIRIRMCDDLPMIDEALDSFMNYLGVNQPLEGGLEEILDMLLQLDNLDNLPDEIKQQFAAIIEQENLPGELADELADRLGMDCPQTGRWMPPPEIPEMPSMIRTDSPDEY